MHSAACTTVCLTALARLCSLVRAIADTTSYLLGVAPNSGDLSIVDTAQGLVLKRVTASGGYKLSAIAADFSDGSVYAVATTTSSIFGKVDPVTGVVTQIGSGAFNFKIRSTLLL